MKLSIFRSIFWFSSVSRKVLMSLAVSDTDFSVFWQPLSEKNSDKRSCIEIREGFAVHLSTRPSGAKGELRVSSWLAISNTREKVRYFFTCVVTAFRRARNPFYNTVVYMIISIYAAMTKFLHFPLSLRWQKLRIIKYFRSRTIGLNASPDWIPPPPQSNWVISEFIRYDYDKMEQKGISGSAAIWDFHQI